jgi:hypothetical protein
VRQPVQEQWLFGGFQSGFNVPLPLILPGRVLPGNGEVRDVGQGRRFFSAAEGLSLTDASTAAGYWVQK